jgi:hypothetical protein
MIIVRCMYPFYTLLTCKVVGALDGYDDFGILGLELTALHA